MKKPVNGDLLEIWEKIKGSPHGLETHIVICTGTRAPSDMFRFLHHFDGALCSAEIKRINRIFEGDDKDVALEKFKAKTKKESQNVY